MCYLYEFDFSNAVHFFILSAQIQVMYLHISTSTVEIKIWGPLSCNYNPTPEQFKLSLQVPSSKLKSPGAELIYYLLGHFQIEGLGTQSPIWLKTIFMFMMWLNRTCFSYRSYKSYIAGNRIKSFGSSWLNLHGFNNPP